MPDIDAYLLGHIAFDPTTATNERVLLRAPQAHRNRMLRNQFVRITDALTPGSVFLGRILGGPFFPEAAGKDVMAEVEVQGELAGNRTHDTNNRPAPGSPVHEISADAVADLLGFDGDICLGCLSGREDLPVRIRSMSKDVLPRNVGIFGTVGSGKSNSVQVLIEEASEHGWAVILLDLEAEYVDMDLPTDQEQFVERLALFGREPKGLSDFHVYYPISCPSERIDSRPFTLRLSDFESSVTAELLQATLAERNALLDCIDHFEQKFQQKLATTEAERLRGLLDSSPQAKLPFTLQLLRGRAVERSSRNSETLDYVGLGSKLQLLMHSGVFDQPNLRSLDVAEMIKPGRVNVLDVSFANDSVKNLVTADLLRKAFAYKVSNIEAPPTMLVIEEAHSFMSREKIHAMQATLQMLRNVTRRGRKRWLSIAFVSQQPGHLPPEIFELCNTRLVHTLRSMHNLDALMATTSDVTHELWARCPLLGTGEAIISTPQFRRSAVVSMRPAASRRRFVK
jgi:DNA helicase HerA-like ATPase